MTSKEIYKEIKHLARFNLMKNEKYRLSYSITKRMKSEVYKKIDQYDDDSTLDFELGIIDDEMREFEKRMYIEMSIILGNMEIR